jgi:hypothetical protein
LLSPMAILAPLMSFTWYLGVLGVGRRGLAKRAVRAVYRI